MNNVAVLSDPTAIALYAFKVQITALKLELKGMRRSGQSASAFLKQTRGYKGSKQKIFELATADYEKEKLAWEKSLQPA